MTRITIVDIKPWAEAGKDLPREPWEDTSSYQQCPVCEVTGKDLSTHAARCKGPREPLHQQRKIVNSQGGGTHHESARINN